jgi:hypothetical protein
VNPQEGKMLKETTTSKQTVTEEEEKQNMGFSSEIVFFKDMQISIKLICFVAHVSILGLESGSMPFPNAF